MQNIDLAGTQAASAGTTVLSVAGIRALRELVCDRAAANPQLRHSRLPQVTKLRPRCISGGSLRISLYGSRSATGLRFVLEDEELAMSVFVAWIVATPQPSRLRRLPVASDRVRISRISGNKDAHSRFVGLRRQ